MAIPSFQELMLPLLRVAADQAEYRISGVIEMLADQFRLTAEEKNERLPSGADRLFDNRARWARFYLGKAGCLDSTGRGRFCITERGLDVVKENIVEVDLKFLGRFPEFAAFYHGSRGIGEQGMFVKGDDGEVSQTPEEALEASYQSLRSALQQELLDRVKQCSSAFFERLVVDLLVAMGYGGSRKDAGQAVGRTGDDGIDGIIKEDRLGLDTVCIQAKKWDGSVGRPVVQAFAGSLEGHRARKGVLITTSQFTSDAKEYVNRIERRIVLIDGEQLVQLMIDHGIGVTDAARYEVKKADADYFEAE